MIKEPCLPALNEDLVKQFISSYENFSKNNEPALVSVIIIAYDTNWELIHCLDSLQQQSICDFETIVVDNGKNEAVYSKLSDYPVRYIRLKKNFKPSIARNIGTVYAKGEIVCFLDDDAIADHDFVAQHLCAHTNNQIMGVRGRVYPKTDSLYNFLAPHYDLGSNSIPSYIDIEGNASYKRSMLLQVGGFNPHVFAGEGAELSYRLVSQFGDPRKLLYWPQTIIYHDYSTSFRKLILKTIRGEKMNIWLRKQYPGLDNFLETYYPFPIGDSSKPIKIYQRLYIAVVKRVIKIVSYIARLYFKKMKGVEPA